MSSWRDVDMTLEEAVDRLRDPIACACADCPRGYQLCYCALNGNAARRLVRAAHIAVKLVAELPARPA